MEGPILKVYRPLEFHPSLQKDRALLRTSEERSRRDCMSKSLSVQIPDEALPAFKRLIALGPDRLRRLTDALRETGPSLDPVSFRAVSASQAMGDIDLSEDVETILRDVIFPIRRTMYRHSISADEMVSELSRAIELVSTSGREPKTLDNEEALRWTG